MKNINKLLLAILGLIVLAIVCTTMTKPVHSQSKSNTDILVLVNKTHPLKSEMKMNLVDYDNQLIDYRIKPSLDKFIKAGEAEGHQFMLVSGYRSISKQKRIYNGFIKANQALGMSYGAAKLETEKTSAPPGTSEHHTGLAVDLCGTDALQAYPTLRSNMENFESQQWLMAHEYGFILRYMKGRESETGFSYEPWHFRFVGKQAAKDIYEHGLTLEEYLDLQ
jgi:D-alanyl-D-alanine carboxypeptidase